MNFLYRGFYAALILLYCGAAFCVTEQPAVKETILVKLPSALYLNKIAVSGDFTKVAYVTSRNAKQVLVTNGKESPAYDEIGTPVFYGADNQLVYSARNGGKWIINWNGKDTEPLDTASEAMTDGNNLAVYYYFNLGDKLYTYLNGVKYEGEVTPVISPDGKRTALITSDEKGMTVSIDGVKSPITPSISNFVFSNDSKRYGYIAEDGEKQKVVIDGKAEPEYEWVSAPMFSPDNKSVVYACGFDGSCFIIRDGKRTPQAWDWIILHEFSSDGKNIAYSAFRDDKWVAVKDNEKSKEYDDIGLVKITPNKKLVFEAMLGDQWMIVNDTVETTGYDKVDLIESDKRIAYLAERADKQFYVIDGKDQPENYIVMGLTFNKDFSDYAYIAKNKNQWHLNVNGEVVGSYNSFIENQVPVFLSEKTIKTAAIKNMNVVLIEVNLTKL